MAPESSLSHIDRSLSTRVSSQALALRRCAGPPWHNPLAHGIRGMSSTMQDGANMNPDQLEPSETAQLSEDDARQRTRAEYLLFRFEKSLGQFVLDQADSVSRIPQTTVDQIRKESGHPDETETSLTWLVQNSYLSTLFDLAVNAPQDEDLSNAVSNLHRWCQGVGIFQVRNAIAHPNRRWLSHYSHVVYALATHPLVFELELTELLEAVTAAEAGRFDPPPDAWRMAVAELEIPNNLSDTVRPNEHGAFVGRRQERKELKRRILSGRFPAVSIVAPGGLGKTALLLICLRDLVRNQQARSKFDLVRFLSAKSKLLTATGAQDLRPDIDEMQPLAEQIGQAILNDSGGTWDQLVAIFGQTRLLLCLDNVENLILDDPEALDQLLLDGFPPTWTVVLTSRIPVNHTSSMQLGDMTHADKESLVRAYASMVGLSGLTKDVVEEIASRATTPLAARIWIDLHRRGQPLDAAFGDMNALTTEFAYSKLVEGLDHDARHLVEALFALDQPIGPARLGPLLDWDSSRLKAAIAQGSRHSLVDRDQDLDRLALSESLREHLSVRTDDSYSEFRNVVYAKWDRLLAEDELVQGPEDVGDATSPERNLDDVHDPDLRRVLAKILALMDTTSFSTSKALAELKHQSTAVAAVHRVTAILHRSAGDDRSFRASLHDALRANRTDWRAGILLAQSYRDAGRYDQALKHADLFIDSLEGNIQLAPIRARFLVVHFTSRIWRASDLIQRGIHITAASGELDQVISETATWRGSEAAETLAGLHSMALRRSAESARTSRERVTVLNRALQAFKDMVADGLTIRGTTASELQHLAEQFLYVSSGFDGADFTPEVEDAVLFLADNMDTILDGAPPRKALIARSIMARFRKVRDGAVVSAIPPEKWRDWNIHEVDGSGAVVLARVYHNPPNRHFLFAEDQDGRQYFVHASKVAPGEGELDQIRLGTILQLWPEETDQDDTGRAIAVTRAEVLGHPADPT